MVTTLIRYILTQFSFSVKGYIPKVRRDIISGASGYANTAGIGKLIVSLL